MGYNKYVLSEGVIILLEELDRLIIFVLKKYDELLKEWKQSELYEPINQKKMLVKDVDEHSNILNVIFNYRSFINKKNLFLKMAFDELKLKSEINTRVKAQNSIEYKINNYMSPKHEYGMVPLNKCFNDLYGIRIIFDESVDHYAIKSYLENKYKGKIKCIDSSKEEGYVATHVYFKNDNYSFLWELQIWDKFHEKSNITLHEQYKQEYTKWENENRGGESFDNTLYNNE